MVVTDKGEILCPESAEIIGRKVTYSWWKTGAQCVTEQVSDAVGVSEVLYQYRSQARDEGRGRDGTFLTIYKCPFCPGVVVDDDWGNSDFSRAQVRHYASLAEARVALQ